MAKGLAVKTLLAAMLGFALLALAYIGVLPLAREFINGLDVLSQPMKFRLRGPVDPEPQVRVIGITENTIAAFKDIDVYYPPLPRQWHALAVTRLTDAGAKVVVLDLLFSEADSWDSAEDETLRDAVAYARERGCAVVLAVARETQQYTAGTYSESLLLPSPIIMEAQPQLGMSNTQTVLSQKLVELVTVPVADAGVNGRDDIPTQAVAAFGRDYEERVNLGAVASRDQRGREQQFFRINYCGQWAHFPGSLYSYERLFADELAGGAFGELSEANRAELARTFADSVVFIGSRNNADKDLFETPVGQMFGVDTNAQAFNTLLSGNFIRAATPVATLLTALVLALTAWLIAQRRPILLSTLIGVAVYIALAAADFLLFSLARYEFSLAMASLGFLVPFTTCIVYSGVAEELAKRRIRGTFSRYVSREIVDQLIANPELAGLGGAERKAAVLFVDIRNYSTITEHLSPQQIVSFLNLYFSEVTELVRQHGGFVDKYLGDGLMAVFGGPVPTTDPAGDALRCALAMVRALKERVNPKLAAAGLPEFATGVGIHYGSVVMGNIGSESRMDYTVVGDAVNVASRVEGQTKEFRCAVIATREALDAAADTFASEHLGERLVKGRAQPVNLFSVSDPECPALFRLEGAPPGPPKG